MCYCVFDDDNCVFVCVCHCVCVCYCVFDDDDCVFMFSVDQRKEYAESINRQMHQFQHRVEVKIIIIIIIII